MLCGAPLVAGATAPRRLPPGALLHVIAAVRGHGSPLSYVVASICAWLDELPPAPTLEPSVELRQDVVRVVFHTNSGFGAERVLRHTHAYQGAGDLRFETEEVVLAEGRCGYVH